MLLSCFIVILLITLKHLISINEHIHQFKKKL